MTDTIRGLLNKKPFLLLDGSMGQELLHRGVPDDPFYWASHALENNAAVVRRLHADYIDAGADIVTTNTYATNLDRFRRSGETGRFVVLNRLACEVAREAIEQSGRRDVLLAASLPPLRASYRPEQVPAFEQALDEFGRHAAVLADFVDLFLCETMSSAAEGRAAATAACAVANGRPVFVSWTLEDGGSCRLRSAEPVTEAIDAVADLAVSGYLVNCSEPESVSAAMPDLCRGGAAVRGGYANGFANLLTDCADGAGSLEFGRRRDLNPAAYAAFARGWLSAGANLVGGCCEIGPAHIAELHALRRG